MWSRTFHSRSYRLLTWQCRRKVNDKYYLYVQHSKDQGISIIDISNPAQPKALGVIAVAGSSFVEQDERDGRFGDHC